MLHLLYELVLWLNFAVTVGACLFLVFATGLLVAAAGPSWLSCVLQRDPPEDPER